MIIITITATIISLIDMFVTTADIITSALWTNTLIYHKIINMIGGFMKKVLFIGGTGLISKSVSEYICRRPDIELHILNRGTTKKNMPDNIHFIKGDYTDKSFLSSVTDNNFDVIVNWIVFTPDQIRDDIASFTDKTGQYIFISTAATYKRPPVAYPVTEDFPLENNNWQYAKDKISCESLLLEAYVKHSFPATIVRPNYTYDKTSIPFIFNSRTCRYTLIDRMRRGKKIIIPGDGTSLFTITHSKDFAKGFAGLAGNSKTVGEAYHITTDEIKTWDSYAFDIGKAAGVIPDILHVPSDLISTISPEHTGGLLGDKSHSMIFDNKKIRAVTPGYKADIRFEDGIRESVEWYDKNKDLQKTDEDFDMLCDKIVLQMNKAYEL